MNTPFDLGDTESYLHWREQKLAAAPISVNELIVEVRDPRALTPNEHAALAKLHPPLQHGDLRQPHA